MKVAIYNGGDRVLKEEHITRLREYLEEVKATEILIDSSVGINTEIKEIFSNEYTVTVYPIEYNNYTNPNNIKKIKWDGSTYNSKAFEITSHKLLKECDYMVAFKSSAEVVHRMIHKSISRRKHILIL